MKVFDDNIRVVQLPTWYVTIRDRPYLRKDVRRALAVAREGGDPGGLLAGDLEAEGIVSSGALTEKGEDFFVWLNGFSANRA